ncbi:MAG TPA: multicopper oxidase domain-containing protein, partial [Candidatus Sulfotelmatobacter sp.]
MRKPYRNWLPILLVCLATVTASAQSFRVQCPNTTITHPAASNDAEPIYTGPTQYACTVSGGCTAANNVGYLVPAGTANGAIKCQQISGGDGYATMADGTQTYMFSFGPLSGLADIANGLPGTEPPSMFNTSALGLQPGDPATTDGIVANTWPGFPLSTGGFSYNGAVGLANDVSYINSIFDISETGNTVTVVLNAVSGFKVGDQVVVSGTGAAPAGYDGTYTVTAINISNSIFPPTFAFQFSDTNTGLPDINQSTTATAASAPQIDGHVDPRQLMDVGVMNGNIPAPLMAIDEDDEFFLTLSNVGMIMRPDLFEQHTVHFHGYPNASSFYDGVPDASVAINIGASFTYYYLAPDAGTYFWHCHITPPEHLQMGMVGQLYVRPRQNRVPSTTTLNTALLAQQGDLRTACRRPSDGASPTVNASPDILCSNPMPAAVTTATGGGKYAYNDGDGTTAYDVEYPLQIHGFDPNFHFVGMTFNPEGFTDMKDKYFLLNGRSYPDTVTPGPLATQSVDGQMHFSQPLPSIINIPLGKKALLRISDLDVTEFQTLASLGIPMTVIGYNAKLLRDQAGNNMYYNTNSITLGGGESLDVILDASNTSLYPSGS